MQSHADRGLRYVLSVSPAPKKSRTSQKHRNSSSKEMTIIDPYGPVLSRGAKKSFRIRNPYLSRPSKKYSTVGIKTVLAPNGARAPKKATTTKPGKLASKGHAKAPSKSAKVFVTSPVVLTKKSNAVLRERRQVMSRREFNAALGDFHRLGREVQLRKVTGGYTILGIAKGSFFYRAGLRKGDVISKLAGKIVHGPDDVAPIYAELMGAKEFSLELSRGKEKLRFHYTFVK